MNYHVDPDINLCMIRLNDAICTFERNTGIGAMLLFVPNVGPPMLSTDGKPIPDMDKPSRLNALQFAEDERERHMAERGLKE